MRHFGIIALFCAVVFFGSFFDKAHAANSVGQKKSEDSIWVVGATSEQQKAFEMSRQKIHEQWEHIRVAGKLEDAGNYKAAIEEYKIALKLAKTKGDTAVPLASLFEVYEKNGDYRLSLEAIDQLILLKPSLATKYAERKRNLLQQLQASESDQPLSAPASQRTGDSHPKGDRWVGAL